MNVKIILTSYFLKFMYGDRAYDDPLLLSREIMKKAYNEGLYYISSNKNIDAVLKSNSKRTLYLFAGIPSFQDVCMNLFPSEELYALKITIPYEAMVNLKYDDEEKVMVGKNVDVSHSEKITLGLIYDKEVLHYALKDENYHYEPDKNQIIKEFIQELESYQYTIKSSVEYLQKRLNDFLSSEACKSALDDENSLNDIKECYEILQLSS
ncbi:hypothetical protein EGP91_05630 [bacterium]|nr:hypothetical protein [bacterium]